MKKRRFFAIFLILALLISLLAGCAKDDHDRKTERTTKSPETEDEPSIVGKWIPKCSVLDGDVSYVEEEGSYIFCEDGSGQVISPDETFFVRWLRDEDILIFAIDPEFTTDDDEVDYSALINTFDILLLTDSELVLQMHLPIQLVYNRYNGMELDEDDTLQLYCVNENYTSSFVYEDHKIDPKPFGKNSTDLETLLKTYTYRYESDVTIIYIYPNGKIHFSHPSDGSEEERTWRVEGNELYLSDGEKEWLWNSFILYDKYQIDGAFYNTDYIP